MENDSPPAKLARSPELVSVVCPVFNERDAIAPFADSLLAVLHAASIRFEVVFVEDDSVDGTLEKLRQLALQNPGKIKVLSMSRRFGHQPSLAAGFQCASGDVIICMDSDLQHPPELIPEMLRLWSEGYQVVYTRRLVQSGRSWFKETVSKFFYRAMDRFSDVHFEEGTADFRLLDRLVIDALNEFQERMLLYRGLVNWVGFKRIAIDYEAPPRLHGESKYAFGRMFRMGVDALFSFSLLPLRITYYIGAISILGSFAYGVWMVVRKMLGHMEVPGYTSIIVLVTFFSGLHLVCLGVIAEYIGRIHEQSKGRPMYLIKERIGFDNPKVQLSSHHRTHREHDCFES